MAIPQPETDQELAKKRLDAALEQSNYRITFSTEKRNLLLKLQANLLYSINGGIFKITRELISFVHIMQDEDSLVLLDNNENPVLIEDVKEFLLEITSKYTEFTNGYYMAIKELNRKRNPATIIGV